MAYSIDQDEAILKEIDRISQEPINVSATKFHHNHASNASLLATS